MTTEQLNIIITAQTADFTEKLGAVNAALRETITLAERAAASAARVTDPAGEGAGEAVPESAADGVYRTSAAEKAAGGFPGVPRESAVLFSPAAAAVNVPRLDRGQTLIGAVSGSAGGRGGEQGGAIEIHTTVELDGDRIGEAVSAYNERQSRITNGF